ncbi:MAG: tail fiber domain-containing protein [Bacteroidales bacterium]|nr:tail fiber domain-containing protein [Bacteroidales bacterium]
MKKILILLIALSSIVSVNAQLTVDSTGKVAINKLSAEYTLDVFGNFRVDNWTDVILEYNSQYYGQPAIYPENSWYLRLGTPELVLGDIFATHIFCHWVSESAHEQAKDNITVLENPLEKIMKIDGVRYIFNHEQLKNMPEQIQLEYQRPQIGFLAENVEPVYPELVVYNKETGKSSISYTRMVPVLLEAIKQQQRQIVMLQDVVASQEKDLIILKNEIESDNYKTGSYENGADIREEAKLFDNVPNPFDQETEIKYFIPENASSANILVFDLQGKEMLSYSINDRTFGSIVIKASTLYPGMFVYSLVVDNKIVNTKRMILTRK